MSHAGDSAGARTGTLHGTGETDSGMRQLPAVRLAQDRLGEQPVVVVVCEPDAAGAAAIRVALEGFDVELVECADGALALLEVGRRQADIVVLTARLPVLDAAAFVATLSQVGRIPVLLGVGEGDGDLAARALTAGASRVLPRPYDPGQVRQAVTAAARAASLRPGPLRRGALVIDPLSYAVTLDGRRIPMPARELEVLMYLARHSDRAVSLDELRDAVWGAERLSTRSKTVAVTTMRLRKSLGDADDPPGIILSVRGHGYRLVAPQPAALTPAPPEQP